MPSGPAVTGMLPVTWLVVRLMTATVLDTRLVTYALVAPAKSRFQGLVLSPMGMLPNVPLVAGLNRCTAFETLLTMYPRPFWKATWFGASPVLSTLFCTALVAVSTMLSVLASVLTTYSRPRLVWGWPGREMSNRRVVT